MSADVEVRRAHLLATFVRDGRLVRLPQKFEKRRLVCEFVADHFEPGERYPEARVDEILSSLTEGGECDHVTLRRYLIDYGLLAREDGVYWRAGGWVAGT